MSYDQELAERVREVAADIDGVVTERKMFGGLTFLLDGNMFAGVVGSELVLRLGEPAAEAALDRKHVREMDFTGRPMKSMVYIEPAGLEGRTLADWVNEAAAFAATLPSKPR